MRTEEPAQGLGLPFDDVRFESRLVWIFGSPRTGSTWLLNLLTFPLTLTTERPSGSKLVRGAPARVAALPINEPYLPNHLTPTFNGFAEPGDPTFVLNPLRADDPSYFFSDAFADSWRPEVRRLVLVRLHAQSELAAREHGLEEPVVVVKEPNGSHGADLVMSLLPRARMIFQLRDGRDVIDSLIHAQARDGWLGGPGGVTGIEGESERLAFVRRHSRLWVNRTMAVQRAYDAHSPELRWTVRYEDLRSDTRRALRPAVDWLGLERSDEELEAAISTYDFDSVPAHARGPTKPLRAATPGLWRENMSAEERRTMEEIMGPKLVELGYEV